MDSYEMVLEVRRCVFVMTMNFVVPECVDSEKWRNI
jgi:hypothetical protein